MKPLLLAMTLFCALSIHAEESSVDLNLGLSASKSVLGLSYNNGRNQINVGLRGISYSGRDGFFLQPGIAYNRYLTDNGFYATAIYTLVYWGNDVTNFNFQSNGQGGYVVNEYVVYEKGWHSDLLMAGLGKSFQFTHWGIHLDAGLSTAANSEFGKVLGLWLGGGFSYRFHLD
jgi:hypothetical protein